MQIAASMVPKIVQVVLDLRVTDEKFMSQFLKKFSGPPWVETAVEFGGAAGRLIRLIGVCF
jgi:hypothetical protein